MGDRMSLPSLVNPTYVQSRQQAELGVLIGDLGVAAAGIGLLLAAVTGVVTSPFLWVSYAGWAVAGGGYGLLARHMRRCGDRYDTICYGLDAGSFSLVALAGLVLPFAPYVAITIHVLGSLLILLGIVWPDAEYERGF